MKGTIIYQSRYGATEQYAKWLAESLDFRLTEEKGVVPAVMARNEMIVIGCPVYVGKLTLRRWLKEQFNFIKNKKLFLFIVCGTMADDPIRQKAFIADNLDPAIMARIQVFFLPGRCIISKLSWKDRIVLQMGAWLEKDPDRKAIMNEGFDQMDRKKLDNLIAAVRRAEKEIIVC